MGDRPQFDFEPMAHWDATSAIATEMRGRGLFTMARSLHYPTFWATALLDTMAEETSWSTQEDEDEELSYFRAMAGYPAGLVPTCKTPAGARRGRRT